MEIQFLFILAASGILIGFVSGLLGIGGGIIMTPVQYWIYTSAGIESDLAIKIAIATSLAVILPTSASGVWQHRKKVPINWKIAAIMGTVAAAGSYIGSTIAVLIPGNILKIIFGIVVMLIAVRMLTMKISDEQQPLRENLWLWIGIAIPIGMLTGILGIGGGAVVIPCLILILHFRMINAVGTSLAMMLFTSAGGIIGYIVNGMSLTGMPAHSSGYIFWPAWLALIITCIPMAQVGAVMAHKTKGKLLTFIFVALMLYIGLDMLGVIDLIAGVFPL
jgi:uncharacterized protein